jgi:murein DD-endopeptidase MepM/ murein hydrolase activator NlpD
MGNNNIDKKITSNKIKLKKEAKNQKITKQEIKKLAFEIAIEEKKSNNIESKLELLSNNIFLNKLKLTKSKNDLKKLNKQSVLIKKKTKQIEEKIVDAIVEKYSITLSKNLINKESIEDVIQKEKYILILDITKDRILKSNITYFQIQNNKRKNSEKTQKLLNYIQIQKEKKQEFKELKEKQDKSLQRLKYKHQIYQKTLKNIITKQSNLKNLLGDLNILRQKDIRKKRLSKLKRDLLKIKTKKKKAKQIKLASKSKKRSSAKKIKINSKKILQENIDLNVKNIGSSIKGIKISNYRGRKTIAPLKSYKISKKFGKYYDPVYKIELFNESISLKSNIKNAKVYSVLKGKIIYAKSDARTLGNVVVVQHRDKIHTVYSQLSNIPKTLKVGKWIPQGYVVGRVKDTLVFQATKNNRYINPVKLFK